MKTKRGREQGCINISFSGDTGLRESGDFPVFDT